MAQFHHYYRLHGILKDRRTPITGRQIAETLNVSLATVRRLIGELQSRGVPIYTSKDPQGYLLDKSVAYELPGEWFTPAELCALLIAHDLLANAEPSLLSDKLQPIRQKIETLLNAEQLGIAEIAKRVRMLRIGSRGPGKHFQSVAEGLARRRRLKIEYTGRSKRDVVINRIVSPLQIAHYRDNWYLDAWCHRAKELRCFAIERITRVRILKSVSKTVEVEELRAHFSAGYGIFGGKNVKTATLVFSAHRARWVREERWHSKQVGTDLPDGRYQLTLPYSNATELLRDIMREGPDVEVLDPPELRKEIAGLLQRSLAAYMG